MNAGGKGAGQGYAIADYDGNDGSPEGMEDMEQAPEDESSGDKTGVAYGSGEVDAGLEEDQDKPKKKRRKRQTNSDIETLESGLSVMKKKFNDYELEDYDKLA